MGGGLNHTKNTKQEQQAYWAEGELKLSTFQNRTTFTHTLPVLVLRLYEARAAYGKENPIFRSAGEPLKLRTRVWLRPPRRSSAADQSKAGMTSAPGLRKEKPAQGCRTLARGRMSVSEAARTVNEQKPDAPKGLGAAPHGPAAHAIPSRARHAMPAAPPGQVSTSPPRPGPRHELR